MKRIENLCRVFELNQPNQILYYIDQVGDPDGGRVKRRNRNMKIDSLVKDIPLEELNSEDYIEYDYSISRAIEEKPGNVVSMQVMSQPVSARTRYTDEQVVYDQIRTKMFQMAKKTPSHIGQKIVVDMTDESYSGIKRAVTKLVLAGNAIAIASRRGPANRIFMDRDMISYFSNVLEFKQIDTRTFSTMNYQVIIDPNITNSTVAWRIAQKDDEPQLMLNTYQDRYDINEIGSNTHLSYIELDIIR